MIEDYDVWIETSFQSVEWFHIFNI